MVLQSHRAQVTALPHGCATLSMEAPPLCEGAPRVLTLPVPCPHRSLGDLGKWLEHFQILFETGGMWLMKLGTVRLSLLISIPSRYWAQILHCSLWEWLFTLHFFFDQLLTLYVQNKNRDIIPQYPTCTKITDLCCFSMSYSNSFGKAM